MTPAAAPTPTAAASPTTQVATIGFTKSSAESFFGRLAAAGVRRLIDVRLNNTSQLSGFAKAGDLAWFLDRLGGIAYEHRPLLAPTAPLLAAYRAKALPWPAYAEAFTALMAEREIDRRFDPADLDGACLLCSEAAAHRCHRRLVCDYLNEKWAGALAVRHL